MRLFCAIGLVITAGLASGCAANIRPANWETVRHVSLQNSDTRCHRMFARIDDAVQRAGARDVEAYKIPGFPYLRVNRFLAHVGTRFKGRAYGPAFEAWVDRLEELGNEGLRIEIENLPSQDFEDLRVVGSGLVAHRNTVSSLAARCISEIRQQQLLDPAQRRLLIANAVVPESYDDSARLLGAFPLTSIPIQVGWENWKRDNLGGFGLPGANIASTGELIEYAPDNHQGVLQVSAARKALARSRSTLLETPEPEGRDLQSLLNAFAPIWQIDVVGNYDRFGKPRWQPDGQSVGIDYEDPTVFTHVSHTVFGGQVLLQLTYAIWFPSRPIESNFDLLGGNLDGLIWRVTLGQNGQPLFYDSIHACGCYHLVFPVDPEDHARPASIGYAMREAPAIIPTTPVLKSGQRIVLRVASANHYLVGVHARAAHAGKNTQQVYRMEPDKVLRSLPLPGGGRRSLYGPNGLIAGTERLERYLLWPSGVLSPGAMRQWGHHAIALTGRRHFDDAELLAQILGRRKER